jgi:aspartate aminotransferase-like enzyme
MLSVSEQAWQAYEQAKMPRYYWDLKKARDYLEKGQTPWTPAVSLCYALDVTLDLMLQERLANIFSRHESCARLARNGIKSLGLSLFAEEEHVSNTVTAISAFSGKGGNSGSGNYSVAEPQIDVSKLIQILKDEYGLVIAGGQQKLAGKIFRIAHMGWITEDDVKIVLDSMAKALPRCRR